MTVLRKFLLVFGGVFFLMSAAQLVRLFQQPADIWWTPMAQGVPLVDSSSRVVVYIRDGALAEHLKAGRLLLQTEAGTAPIAESEVRMRFNNWDRVRAERSPSLIGFGICLGASGVFFLLGLLGWGPVTAASRGQQS
jgi:hypothetical protein